MVPWYTTIDTGNFSFSETLHSSTEKSVTHSLTHSHTLSLTRSHTLSLTCSHTAGYYSRIWRSRETTPSSQPHLLQLHHDWVEWCRGRIRGWFVRGREWYFRDGFLVANLHCRQCIGHGVFEQAQNTTIIRCGSQTRRWWWGRGLWYHQSIEQSNRVLVDKLHRSYQSPSTYVNTNTLIVKDHQSTFFLHVIFIVIGALFWQQQIRYPLKYFIRFY